jgi:B3 DNA binding domain
MIETSNDDVDEHIACSYDLGSDLSDFLDSLLDANTPVHTVDDDKVAHTVDDDDNDVVNATLHTVTNEGVDSVVLAQDKAKTQDARHHVASPASSSVRTPTPRQRVPSSTRHSLKPRKNCKRAQSRDQSCAPVRRVITNTTYLRRLYLSPEQAFCLMPSIKSSFIPVTLSRRVRALRKQKVATCNIKLVSSDGRKWTTVFECFVSTNGQLHCHFVAGWSLFCQANSVAVHDSVVLKPSCGAANEIEAHIERGPG